MNNKTQIIRSVNIEDACKKYPAIRSTMKLAEKHDLKITGHAIKLNQRGKVCQHILWVIINGKIERWPNQILLGMLRTWDEAIKRKSKTTNQ